jgi:hypothetical protein
MERETPAGAISMMDLFQTPEFANKFGADCAAGGNVN